MILMRPHTGRHYGTRYYAYTKTTCPPFHKYAIRQMPINNWIAYLILCV